MSYVKNEDSSVSFNGGTASAGYEAELDAVYYDFAGFGFLYAVLL